MTEFKYDASVIIPVYNRINLLEMTLEALTEQNTGFSFEVIVCDDGSSEEILSLIKKFNEKLEINYYYQPDLGFRVAKARNAGIALAKGETLIFLDNGIIASSYCVEEHIKSHSKNTYLFLLGYVYGFDDYNVHENALKYLIDLGNIDATINNLEQNKIYDKRERLYEQLGDNLSKWPAPYVVSWSTNFSILSKNIDTVGLYDESYTSYGGEDTDFAIQCSVNGLEINLNRAAAAFHYPHEKNKVMISEEELMLRTKMKRQFQNQKYQLDGTNIWPDTQTFDVNRLLLMDKIKVIISDLDGTINKSVDQINEIREKIQNLKSKGFLDKFIINTGRNLNSFKSAIEKYHLDFFDYAICSSGGIIIDKDLNIILESALSDEKAQRIHDITEQIRPTEVYIGFCSDQKSISDIAFELKSREDGDRAFNIAKKELAFENLTILLNGKYLDISHGDSDKWSSSLELLGILYPEKDTVVYAFGDGENDSELLCKSDFSFSFDYADNQAKEMATFVLKDMVQGLDKIEQQLLLSGMKAYE